MQQPQQSAISNQHAAFQMPTEISINDIPDGGTMSVQLPSGDRVCLIRRGNQVNALRDECTHQAMPLSAGEVLEDGTIECAWHGARFDCATGAVLRGPAEDDVQAYEVSVEGETVLVKERSQR
jgi:3-phenylpropionate/trans-cinnamate dioxygenase ferredoxin subunit